MTLTSFYTLTETGVFSTQSENFAADPLGLVIEMKKKKKRKTDFKSSEDHFSRQCSGLQGTFLTA